MSRIAAELRFGQLASYNYKDDTYNPNKLGLGPLMVQLSGSDTTNDNWTGPLPVGIVRPMEYSSPFAVAFPCAVRWSKDIDWVFFSENSAAGATRRIMKATYDRRDGSFGIDGFILAFFPTTTNQTIRGFRVTLDLHSTGTIAAQGNVVTGYGTNFLSGISSGNRIGFGTTVPSGVSVWYDVSGANTNTNLVLTGPVDTVFNSGTSYVIEDLRNILITTNATTTNGGVFVIKGLRHEIYTPGGTNIQSTGTVDNRRLCYHLIDNNVVLNTIALGGALEDKTDLLNQSLYVLDGTTNPILYRYNVRAPLNGLVLGRTTAAFVLKTSQGGVLAGTASQANNGRLANPLHGPGAGVDSLYFTTTTRVYRTSPLSSISSGSAAWIADNATEVPPGGTFTYAASSLMNSIEYASKIDKFIIPVNATTIPFRSYVTDYYTDGSQFDRIWGSDSRQTDQGSADSSTTLIPSFVGAPYSVWSEEGVCYISTIGTTAITNRCYTIPLGADWEYASTSDSRIITPEISTPNNARFIRASVNEIKILGGRDGKNLGMPTEPYKVYFRTAGITNDSGGWTVLEDDGDLSSIAGSSSIQLMFEFKTIGLTCIPSRLLSATVTYEDLSTLSNYQPSVGNSSITNKIFAWRLATAFGGTVPALRVRLFDAVTNGLLVDDNTVAPAGTFQKSTDGGSSWGAYNTTDKANETTYIRFTPQSLGDNIRVAAVLTLNT